MISPIVTSKTRLNDPEKLQNKCKQASPAAKPGEMIDRGRKCVCVCSVMVERDDVLVNEILSDDGDLMAIASNADVFAKQ